MWRLRAPTASTTAPTCSTPNLRALSGSMRVESKLVSCAIDFGTSGTGFAYRDMAGKAPTELSRWQGTTNFKTLTEVLILERNVGGTIEYTVDAFGYLARDRVRNMDAAERIHMYHFRNFKMHLEGESSRNNIVSDTEYPARTMSLDVVIQKVIEHVKAKAMRDMENTLGFTRLSESDVQWVVTVPAIWDQAARLFMRDVCLRAKLSDVMIVLEAEAASLAVKKAFQIDLTPGAIYLMVDAGGGTVDITMHKCTSPTELCELCPPTGGPWGSTKVNAAAISFLGRIFDEGGDVFSRAKQDVEWFRLEDEIEEMKCSAETQNLQLTAIGNTLALLDKPAIPVLVKKYNLEHPVLPVNLSPHNELRLPPAVFTNFISKQAEIASWHIRQRIKEVLPGSVSPKVFLVGGFAASPIYRQVINDFLSPLVVKWPNRPISAVAEGAVEFGIHPMSISQRCVPYTYSILTSDLACKHPGRLVFLTEQGEKRCHVLKTFVKCRDTLDVGHSTHLTFYPLTPNQESVVFSVFKSKKREILYPDEPGLFLVKGGLEVKNIPNLGSRVERRAVDVTLQFGSTLISVEAKTAGSSASWTENIYSCAPPEPLYHIVFCLDESGSMYGEKWAELKEAVLAFTKCRLIKCPNGDSACIVTYSASARIRSPTCSLSTLLNHPLEPDAGHSTNFAAGLELCDKVLADARGDNKFAGRTPILLFMSDGLCGNGVAEMKLLQAHYKDCGLKTFVVGFGQDVDTVQLESLTAAAGGYISFGKSGAELLNAFTQISSALSSQLF